MIPSFTTFQWILSCYSGCNSIKYNRKVTTIQHIKLSISTGCIDHRLTWFVCIHLAYTYSTKLIVLQINLLFIKPRVMHGYILNTHCIKLSCASFSNTYTKMITDCKWNYSFRNLLVQIFASCNYLKCRMCFSFPLTSICFHVFPITMFTNGLLLQPLFSYYLYLLSIGLEILIRSYR